jgi:hypothetical protein
LVAAIEADVAADTLTAAACETVLLKLALVVAAVFIE